MHVVSFAKLYLLSNTTRLKRGPILSTHGKLPNCFGSRSPRSKRFRHKRISPNWIEMEGRISYDVAVLPDFIRKNTRVASVRAAMEETREAV